MTDDDQEYALGVAQGIYHHADCDQNAIRGGGGFVCVRCRHESAIFFLKKLATGKHHPYPDGMCCGCDVVMIHKFLETEGL